MTRIELSELGAVADRVRNGETIEVVDGERVVGKLSGVRKTSLEDRLEELARQGKVKKGTGTLPDSLLNEPPPKFNGSVLEQLLQDRESDW